MVLLVSASNCEPGSKPPQANKWFHCRDWDLSKECVMWRKWIPTKKEIEKLIDQKLHEFVAQENKNLCLSKEEWLNRYPYTEEHKIFFCSFPCKLYEWLAKLVAGKGTWKLDNPIVWTP